MDGPYCLPFCSVLVALTGAASWWNFQLLLHSKCTQPSVISYSTSRKEVMAWYFCRPMSSLWLQPQHSERVRSGCIGISERNGWYNSAYTVYCTLQRHYTENLKQIFSGMKLRGLVPNSYIHNSVSNLYIPTIDLPILLQENTCRWTDCRNI
jgi:hypothetical protein